MSKIKNDVFYTYIDWTNEIVSRPFYIGKGNSSRIKSNYRNVHHSNVMKKYGFNREIILMTSVEKLAFDLEIELIAKYHTFIDDPSYNEIGCNYTSGGEGHVPSKAECLAISARAKARWADPVFATRMKNSMKGGNVGKKRSPEWCKNKSDAMSGENNPNFGKEMSDETKDKQRQKKIGKPSPLKGKKVPESIVSKKFKRIVVTDSNGNTQIFMSRKYAAEILAEKLGLSHHTLLYYFVKQLKSFHGYTFTYDNE